MRREAPRFNIARAYRHHSTPWRKAAAAANGPSTRLPSVSAHKIMNGAPKPDPVIAAFEAATPKISTGTVSGSTSTGSSNPPRRSATESAAPISPMQVSAGVPASSVSATAAIASGSRLRNRPSSGVAIDQRQAGGDPVRQRFRQHGEFQRRAAPSATDRASRPRGRRRTAGRARAARRAARRSTGSRGRCAGAARGRVRSRTA